MPPEKDHFESCPRRLLWVELVIVPAELFSLGYVIFDPQKKKPKHLNSKQVGNRWYKTE